MDAVSPVREEREVHAPNSEPGTAAVDRANALRDLRDENDRLLELVSSFDAKVNADAEKMAALQSTVDELSENQALSEAELSSVVKKAADEKSRADAEAFQVTHLQSAMRGLRSELAEKNITVEKMLKALKTRAPRSPI